MPILLQTAFNDFRHADRHHDGISGAARNIGVTVAHAFGTTFVPNCEYIPLVRLIS